MIHRNQGTIAEIKKDKYQNQKERSSSVLLVKRTITRTPEQYKKMSKILDVQLQGRQKRPNECVCVKEKVFVHNNTSNNNMITEMKHNRIINVKNKVMNDI